MSDDRPGYDDTPQLPNSEYCVHDPDRPHPEPVDPGGPSSATDATPPADATILFDGHDLSAWEASDGGEPCWTVEDGVMCVAPETGDVQTREPIGDCQLHIEWQAPIVEDGGGQLQSNSGVFLQDRYEIQVLDNHENPTYADGYAGAVYGQSPPLVNACRPPGEWQAYDIVWRGPRFDGDAVTRPARVTILHNGVVVQDATELIGQTTHRAVGEYEPHPPAAPLRLQDHGDLVRFRNVWYRDLE
jgi:hypothetical protein